MTEEGPVLVTGATGFVGWHLLGVLAVRGVRVRALVRPQSDTTRLEAVGAEVVVGGGLEDREAVARAVDGVGVVLHLAAATRARGEAEYRRANADGTRVLLEAVRASRGRVRRVVYLSTLAAVGPSVDGRPVTAAETPRPLTAYGRSKLAGERICLEAAEEGIEVVVLRAPAVYGPRDRDLLTFFRLAARGLLPVPAGDERRLQLVHVADLAEALVCGATAPGAAGVYHIADPRPYSWREVVEEVARAVGRRARMVRVPGALVHAAALASEWSAALGGRATIFNRDKARELLAPGWLCETEAARRDLGFEARIPLPQGLAETAAWYRAAGWL
ncbi:MAG TPA: NAD-dependent epimerase/dehydratase family protein [Longimicrobiales bacterium]